MIPDTICEMMEQSAVDGAIIPPSVLGEMSHDDTHIEKLSKMALVITGGGKSWSVLLMNVSIANSPAGGLEKEAGDRLVSHGVVLSSVIASTE